MYIIHIIFIYIYTQYISIAFPGATLSPEQATAKAAQARWRPKAKPPQKTLRLGK